MARLGIAGLTGSVSLTIETSGGESGALTATASPVPPEPSSIAFFPATRQTAILHAINTVGTDGNRVSASTSAQQPPSIGAMGVVDSVIGGTTMVFSRLGRESATGAIGKIAADDCLADGAYDGGTAHVYRVASGAMTYIGSGTIESSRIARYASLLGTGNVIQPGETQAEVSITSAEWLQDAMNLDFAVASVGSDGRCSAPSTAVAVSVAAGPRTASPNTNVTTPLSVTRHIRNAALAAPTGVAVTALETFKWRVTWTLPADMTGVAGFAVLAKPRMTEDPGAYIVLASGGPTPQAGDLVVVQTTILQPRASMVDWRRQNDGVANALVPSPRSDSFSAPVTAQRYHAHEDLPAMLAITSSPGHCYRRITVAGASNHAVFSRGSAHLNYRAGRTYRFEFLARCPSGSLSMRVRRSTAPLHDLPTITVDPLPSTWTLYAYEFSPAADTTATGHVTDIAVSGSGEIDLCCAAIWDTARGFNAPTQTDEETFLASPVSVIRTHAFIKSKWRTYNLMDLLCPTGSRDNAQTRALHTLPQTLAYIAARGADPWLQIDMNFGPPELAAVMEYLAEPYDPETDTPAAKPYAAMRHGQGRTAPWTDAFGEIIFEMGNETWNTSTFPPWVFDAMTDSVTSTNWTAGHIAGMYNEMIAQAIKATPQWASVASKWKFALGGQAYGVGWTGEALSRFPSCDILSIALYNGGSDGGGVYANSTLARSYRRNAMFGPQVYRDNVDRLEPMLTAFNTANGRRPEVAIYEAGPGAQQPNTAGWDAARVRLEDEVLKSPAQAVGYFGDLCDLASRGVRLTAFYSGERVVTPIASRFTSHHTDGRPHAHWEMIRLFNATMAGDLKALLVQARRTYQMPSITSGSHSARDVDLISAYLSVASGRVSLAVVNRAMPWAAMVGSLTGLFDAPNEAFAAQSGFERALIRIPRPSGSLTLRAFAHPYNAHTLDGGVLTWTETALAQPADPGTVRLGGDDAAAWGLTADGVPPCSVHVWTWE